MNIWQFLAIVSGVLLVLTGLLKKKFSPLGVITMAVWGYGPNARIPRWIAATFYILAGLLMIYFGLTGRI
jgi:hypothetical protein